MKTKKIFSIITAAALFACIFSGCAKKDDGRLKVICTLFPQYDFVRVIAGDKVNLTLLLEPGVNCHTYTPDTEEVTAIIKNNLLIYTNDAMEPWVADKMSSVKPTQTYVLNASNGINLDTDMSDESLVQTGKAQPLEPHVWLYPPYAIKMVDNITARLCVMDAKNAEFYKTNAAAYKLKLKALDTGFKDAVKNGKRKTVIFGDRFAFYYFVKEYSLGYLAAYPSCTSAAEPSAAALARMENAIKLGNIPVVFYREFSDQKTAKLLSEKTGAKLLFFHSCENLTQSETEAGATYLSLMQQNLANLKIALS